MGFNFMLPLRTAQVFLAVLVLALDSYVASWYDLSSASPSQINFLIVSAIITLFITLVYLTIFPKFLPQFCHRYAILAAEAITMVFWLAAFLSTAIFMSGLEVCRGSVCMSARAGVVFAAFEWLLFAATTTMAVIYVFRTRDSTSMSSRTAKVLEANEQNARNFI